jgi:uncharacterized delta-60 repeat protein
MKISRWMCGRSTDSTFQAELLEDRCLFAANALDTSFGGTGAVTSKFGTSSQFTSVIALPDGKVLAAGTVENGAKQHDFLVVRYNANGSLDTTFGGGTGRVFTDFAGRNDFAAKVLLTGSGKFAVVGSTQPGDPNTLASYDKQDFAVARYNANGSLDTTFSGDGKAQVDFFGQHDTGATAAMLDGGKMLVVGTSDRRSDFRGNDFGAVRFNVNGTIDTTFANNGKLASDFGVYVDNVFEKGIYGEQVASAVAILPGGGFVIAGGIDDFYDSGVNFSDFAVAKYTAKGNLDTSFGGGDGWMQVRPSGQYAYASSLAILNSGKILVGGSALPQYMDHPSFSNFALVRLNANGSLDSSFGSGGKASTTVFSSNDPNGYTNSDSRLQGFIVQPNGKIVATGPSRLNAFDSASETTLTAVVRYNANGSLDTSFSGDGKQLYGQIEGSNAIAAAPGGKTVVAGYWGNKAGVLRFQSDSAATASISGTFFNDLDGDGVKDASEKPLAGWKAFIDSNNDGVFTPGEKYAVTDSSGKYKLSGLTPGTYRIREVRLTGWNRTKPAGVYPLGYYDVTVAVGQAVFGKDFGNKKA